MDLQNKQMLFQCRTSQEFFPISKIEHHVMNSHFWTWYFDNQNLENNPM